jgi:uncharacterized iron-regulated membrane protein
MKVKKLIGKLHLWLGFTSGLVVFIVAITGCLYAFQMEIQELVQPFRFVTKQDQEVLPPSRLRQVAEAALPGKHIHAVLYSGADRAAQVIFFSFDPEYYYIAFVNPYSSELLKVMDVESNFFHFILDGHFYLWLPPEIGQTVVATATLIFVVMIITGLVLWWRRKKQNNSQRFKIKWSARWRRLNYDLHNVPGFYVSIVALLFALTGLVWGFQWFANGVYSMSGGNRSLTYVDPLSDSTVRKRSAISGIDEVFHRMKKEYPEAQSIEVHIPESDRVAIAANANPDLSTYWKIDYRYFDQNTLQETSVDHIYGRFPEARNADKLIRMNYDIHTGAILGFPGKVLAFFGSLICASLPVTGFVIWWGRKNKIKNSPVKKSVEMFA